MARGKGRTHEREWPGVRGGTHEREWPGVRGGTHEREWPGVRGGTHEREWPGVRGGTHEREWSGQVRSHQYSDSSGAHGAPKLMLLGNKVDLEVARKVTHERGLAEADMTGTRFAEISAKTGENAEKVRCCSHVTMRMESCDYYVVVKWS